MSELTTLDGLVRRAAGRAPRRPALRVGVRTVSFADLDAAVDRVAGALAGPVGVVAVVATLHPAFPIAYYGAMRAGHACAVLSPLSGEDDLLAAVERTGARLLIAPAVLADRLRRVRLAVPRLAVVYLDRPGESGAPTVAGLRSARPSARPSRPHAAARLRLTETAPVPVSHRDAVERAARRAAEQRLGPESVLLTHGAAYHPAQLDAALHAGATQVLGTDPDPGSAVALAGRTGATHYYSAPTTLARIAADPWLATRRMPAVRTIVAAGPPLAPVVAARLSVHFHARVLSVMEDEPCPTTGSCAAVAARSSTPNGSPARRASVRSAAGARR